MLPLGHFILQNTQVSKCFIGTGTGFAPLYCQIIGMCDKNITDTSVAFIFGVREERDMFYNHQITEIGTKFLEFDYQTYLSREDKV
jgi:NAD(P)H-flavin reductase